MHLEIVVTTNKCDFCKDLSQILQNKSKVVLIIGTAKVGETSTKSAKTSLKWHGHVLRREEEWYIK